MKILMKGDFLNKNGKSLKEELFCKKYFVIPLESPSKFCGKNIKPKFPKLTKMPKNRPGYNKNIK